MLKTLVPIGLILAMLACNFPTTTVGEANTAVPIPTLQSTPLGAVVPPPTLPPTRDPSLPVTTPTPDNAHSLPTVRSDYVEYVVQPYDYLSAIADQFGITLEDLIASNNLADPNALEVGQILLIPPQTPVSPGPDFKIIPDSELVNGPAALSFNVAAFVDAQPGYLKQHREEVDQIFFSGAEIVQRVSIEYSVNPKLLLAVLEFQSGWLSDPNPRSSTVDFPMGITDVWRIGLYRQLSWAADRLNQGYYDWNEGLIAGWHTSDSVLVPASPSINAGTAGVQYIFSLLYPQDQWREIVSSGGFDATYTSFFGYPFDLAIDPLVPMDLTQPTMQLPFEPGVPWVFSGGPHGGWGEGSGWAALDFAPPDMLGCNTGDEWVVAVTDGLVVRSENGVVVQDIDNDGYEQTGWTVLYLHVAADGRVQAGRTVHAGDRIGHPSCEGGVVTATHLHLARRYNGEWIPASGSNPFILDGWVATSSGDLYDGVLQRGGQSVEACECRDPAHMLQR
ncbi:MAG: LysM peptidoglycan-binding domain-containing M23 family metallopeptidase [Anaerolineales bacterium]